MKKNLQILITISIVLCGFLLGNNSFAWSENSPCKLRNTTESIVWPHFYTCQPAADKNKAAGYLCDVTKNGDSKFLVDSWPGDSCNVEWFICHRCICANWAIEVNGQCEEAKKCPEGTKLNERLNSCDPVALTTPTATIPVNTPQTTAATVELTPEELCDARIKNKEDVKRDGNACVSCTAPGVCCGVELNTNVPFVGKCIRLWNQASSSETNTVTETTAFPRLMWWLTKILTTIILLVSFGWIIVGGVMIASSGGDSGRAKTGKELIGKIIMAIAILWASGIILHLINPNFF